MGENAFFFASRRFKKVSSEIFFLPFFEPQKKKTLSISNGRVKIYVRGTEVFTDIAAVKNFNERPT